MPRRVNPQVKYLEPDFWIADYIKNVGDKNNRGSSLKCDVTHWTMHQDEAFWEITEQINVMANDLLIDRHGCVEICEMWGGVYKRGDYAVIHMHPDPGYVQSFIWYIDACPDCAPLVFPDPERPWMPPAALITPSTGVLAFFSSTDLHYVPPHECDHERIIISGNIQIS